jgi:hypothetical protein
MQLSRDGAQHFPAALNPEFLERLEHALADVAVRPGTRLTGNPALSDLLQPEGPIGRLTADPLGPAAKPVRALLFNKTPEQNWSLGWHQDRTIAVRNRAEARGFTHWTIKSGIQHVEPPFELLERMLTLRIHLDAVDAENAPLLITPGSHRLGRIPEPTLPPWWSASAPGPVSPNEATYGSIRRRSSTPPKLPAAPPAAAFFRSTIPLTRSRPR